MSDEINNIRGRRHCYQSQAVQDIDYLLSKIDAAATFIDWLKNREQWLTNEISGGGSWEHLNARRSECAYIRERFERLSSADTKASVRPVRGVTASRGQIRTTCHSSRCSFSGNTAARGKSTT